MKQDEQANQYRLHHLPFLVMWVASFGVAWIILFLSFMLWSDIKNTNTLLQEFAGWIYSNARWVDGVLIGAGLGAFLMLVQPWLMRWRYGFVPRFWRLTTFFGAMLGGSFFSEFIYNNGYYDANGVWTYPNQLLPVVVWFGSLTLVQTLALWPVVRRAFLFPLAGFGAIGLSVLMGTAFTNYYGMSQTNMLLYGTIAQAVFSGALFLWLMRDYRVEAVAKRDEKSKVVVRVGLHPISFIGLWAMAHLFGWVTAIVLSVIYTQLRDLVPLLREIPHWQYPYNWLTNLLAGLIIGGVTAVAEGWLIQQQSGMRPKWWLRLSLPAWAIAGLALETLMRSGSWAYVDLFGTPQFSIWNVLPLLLWFGMPPFIQSISLWREWRGAWLYTLSGIVSAVMAYFVCTQFLWTYNGNGYAVLFGAVSQAILTGAAFLSILAQNRQGQADESSEVLPQEA